MNGKEVLTANEYRMIETIATGRSDKEAAYYLNKAYSTFKNTKNKIFDKLGIPHNTSALVAWYYCIKNEVQLPEFIRTWDAKGIMAGIILLAFIPNEMICQSETYREVRRGREIETICRRGRGREEARTISITSVIIS